jgi:hypothetical protein
MRIEKIYDYASSPAVIAFCFPLNPLLNRQKTRLSFVRSAAQATASDRVNFPFLPHPTKSSEDHALTELSSSSSSSFSGVGRHNDTEFRE